MGLTGVEAVLLGKLGELIVIYRNDRDLVAHGEVGDSGGRDTGNAEESVDLFVLQSVSRRPKPRFCLLMSFSMSMP